MAVQSKPENISVCICTYKRPKLLLKLLEELGKQKTERLFTFSAVIVDNDIQQSARDIVETFKNTADFNISYYYEPVQNIALARNKAVKNARGDYLAFIDDDEVPVNCWLFELYAACRKYNADGVLGPVRPLFTSDTPTWLIRSGICERPSHKSGTVLDYLQTRTGNVLIKRSILDGMAVPFPPEMGREGGEDMAFFKRVIAKGNKIVWCEEAPAYENIVPDRFRRIYYINKYLRIGGLTGELYKNDRFEKWMYIWRSGFSALFFAFIASLTLLFAHHVFMRSLVKLTYHVGLIIGCFGIVPVRQRRER